MVRPHIIVLRVYAQRKAMRASSWKSPWNGSSGWGRITEQFRSRGMFTFLCVLMC